MGTPPTNGLVAQPDKIETVHLSLAIVPANNSNAAQDGFDWNTLEGHQSPTRTPFTAANILEASTTSKMKVEHSASLDLSTSIDTEELEELTPTRIQSPRFTKKQKTQSRR
ncbi:hypothetical protein V6N13_048960 [Hibiscus sabdariffa]